MSNKFVDITVCFETVLDYNKLKIHFQKNWMQEQAIESILVNNWQNKKSKASNKFGIFLQI